ncbi:Calcium/calmodulin-dependent protein kinase type 1D [Physocladia obscura]|uniref:Calcium/calmodulin-dependent protein kinase type 1D n=1 Tax=Physocladia obscura TaxID=109957 RepID=A0AAD5XH58_9FUNG|nr:Calcium/calmodulin-dependent protein kinase type 1D [Physocladia obscura]
MLGHIKAIIHRKSREIGAEKDAKDDQKQVGVTCVDSPVPKYPGANPASFESVYTASKTLGQGSFATVFLAERNSDKAQYAVKVIDKHNKKILASELRSEISILQKVHHEHLITLEDYFETDNKVYLVTQLATGGELFDLIEQRGFFSEKDAAEIISQLLSAIESLHSLGIVHRDLKPENILLKDKSSKTHILVTDFGLSKMATNDHILHTTCGSPIYVSPEVLLKTPGHGRPVDLWAVGVISYILLVGYTPFWGESQADLFQAIKECDYEFDEEHWSHISDLAKDFISKLLDPNPDTRLTATEALKHRWLSNNHEQDILPSVKQNFNSNKLKQAARAVIIANRLLHVVEKINRDKDHSNEQTLFVAEKLMHSLSSNEDRLKSGNENGVSQVNVQTMPVESNQP